MLLMVYSIKEVSPDCYQVRNMTTGKITAKKTTLGQALKQLAVMLKIDLEKKISQCYSKRGSFSMIAGDLKE